MAKSVDVIPTDELRATADKVRREIMKREDAARIAANRDTVGKCYRYRNCYSCPEKPSDYWWLYTKVVGLEGPNIFYTEFEVAKDGRISINFNRQCYASMIHGHVEIRASEFNKAWRALQSKIAKSRP